MKWGLLIFCLAISTYTFGHKHFVTFEHDTLQLGDITREMANQYTVHFHFKNISSTTLYFLNEATAWNDVSDFSHYAHKVDSVGAGRPGTYTVKLCLGSKRWIHYHGTVIFRKPNQTADTIKLYLTATVHDSLLPIHQDPLIHLNYPYEKGEYRVDLGSVNLCSKQPYTVLSFRNISPYILTYEEHAIIWNNSEIQFQSKKNWREPCRVLPGQIANVEVEFRHPKEGPFDMRQIHMDDTLPYTITAIDENGTLIRKHFYFHFTGTFYCERPPFIVYPTMNKEQYKKENSSPSHPLTDSISDFKFITIFIADDHPHTFQLKRKQTPEHWIYIPFITFNYNYSCLPPDNLKKMSKNFSYYWSYDEREMEPYKSVSIGYMVQNKNDLDKINWNDIDFYIDGKRVWLNDFIKKYHNELE